MMFFKLLFALSLRSSDDSGSMYTAKSLDGTSASARAFACSDECRPIYPRVHAAPALM